MPSFACCRQVQQAGNLDKRLMKKGKMIRLALSAVLAQVDEDKLGEQQDKRIPEVCVIGGYAKRALPAEDRLLRGVFSPFPIFPLCSLDII